MNLSKYWRNVVGLSNLRKNPSDTRNGTSSFGVASYYWILTRVSAYSGREFPLGPD